MMKSLKYVAAAGALGAATALATSPAYAQLGIGVGVDTDVDVGVGVRTADPHPRHRHDRGARRAPDRAPPVCCFRCPGRQGTPRTAGRRDREPQQRSRSAGDRTQARRKADGPSSICAEVTTMRASSASSAAAIHIMPGSAPRYPISKLPACVAPSAPTRPARSIANRTGNFWIATSCTT